MIKQSLPAVSSLTKDTLEDFKTADKVVVVAYLDPKDQVNNEIFSAIAEGQRDSFLFGAVTDAAVATTEGVTAPALVIYKKFDEGKDVMTDKFETENIQTFIKTNSIPTVGEVGPETYAGYMAAGIPLAYIFAETEKERTTLAELLKPVAQKYKGKVNFGTIDAKAFGAHAGNLNLKADVFPAFAIQDIAKNQKFPFSQDNKITVDSISEFVESFTDGTMKPSIKSEPIPETQEGPVTVIVAHNYEDVVINNEKDVLVEFYAPWCGHCKSLAPKYEELAALYAAKTDKVTIAKVDATANDVPDEIQGFPTIKLFPAGGKSAPVTYSGPRTVEDLAKFIADNGKHGVAAGIAGIEIDDAPESLGEAAAAATKSASSVAEEATKAAKDKASKGSKAASGAASKASKVASDAASKASAAATDAASKASEAATKATKSVKSAAGGEDHDEL